MVINLYGIGNAKQVIKSRKVSEMDYYSMSQSSASSVKVVIALTLQIKKSGKKNGELMYEKHIMTKQYMQKIRL